MLGAYGPSGSAERSSSEPSSRPSAITRGVANSSATVVDMSWLVAREY
jgi:hypothetical protein